MLHMHTAAYVVPNRKRAVPSIGLPATWIPLDRPRIGPRNQKRQDATRERLKELSHIKHRGCSPVTVAAWRPEHLFTTAGPLIGPDLYAKSYPYIRRRLHV